MTLSNPAFEVKPVHRLVLTTDSASSLELELALEKDAGDGLSHVPSSTLVSASVFLSALGSLVE